MNPLFSRMTKKYTPVMNRRIMEGMAVESLKYIEEYLDGQIRSVCQGMPSCLRYEGYQRCTDQEEYEEITRLRLNRRQFDLAHSSVYMVKFFFVFTDQLGKEHPIIRFVYLPFVGQAGILSVSGSKYHIVPVLSDKVFTPGNDSIFVRLTQDRNNMFRNYNTVLVNERRETRHVVWATIYRSPEAKKSSASAKKPRTLLVHYLFGKYGFSDAFQRYAGHVPVIGYGDDINSKDYPEDQWIICQSTRRRPESAYDRVYTPSSVRLAIPKENWTQEMQTMVYGFFYVIDHFPDRFEPRQFAGDTVDGDGVVTGKTTKAQRTKTLLSYVEDVSLWKILIGVIVFGPLRGENALYKDIAEHFESLDAYLDTEAKKKLGEKNIVLENYYDLLAYIAINFNQMLQEGNESGLNVYGKNLEVLSYVLYDILYNLTSMKFSLNKAANRRPLSLKDITSNFQQYVKMGEIFKIHTGKIITKAVSYSGDHMYPGITAVITEQENRAGAERGQSSRTVVGPQHRIDLSMITVGSVLNLPKSNPTPVARINMWVTIDELTGTVIPNPKFEELMRVNRPFFKF